MGFILDAIGAAANAGGDIMADQRKSELQSSRRGALSADIEQRQMRLSEYNHKMSEQGKVVVAALRQESRPQELADKTEAADAARLRRAAELQRARGDAVNSAVTDKANAAYGNGSALEHGDLSPEELAAPELQLSDAEKRAAFKQAGIDTGQIDAKAALTDDARLAAREQQARIAQTKGKATTIKTGGSDSRSAAAADGEVNAVAIDAAPPSNEKAVASVARKLGVSASAVRDTLDLLKQQAAAGNQTAVRRMAEIADDVKAMSASPADAPASTQSPTAQAGITPVADGDARTGMTAGMRKVMENERQGLERRHQKERLAFEAKFSGKRK
jgi:hypothetical protein